MADNVPVTAGSGTTIGTDDVAGVHIQKVKLVDGTADSSVAITGTTGALDVNVASGTATISGTVDAVVTPDTTGGLTIFRSLDLDESEEAVKASAGQVYGWYMHNTATSERFVKFYNATTASVTVGSTTPVMTIPLPADAAANVEFTNGIAFSTAITVAATTAVADADTGAPSANDVVVNIFYA